MSENRLKETKRQKSQRDQSKGGNRDSREDSITKAIHADAS